MVEEKEPVSTSTPVAPPELAAPNGPEIVHVSAIAPIAGIQETAARPPDDAQQTAQWQAARMAREQDAQSEHLGWLAGVAFMVLLGFRAAVWPNVPWDWYVKWLVLGGIVAVFGVIGISLRARQNRFFASLRNAIIVLVIT